MAIASPLLASDGNGYPQRQIFDTFIKACDAVKPKDQLASHLVSIGWSEAKLSTEADAYAFYEKLVGVRDRFVKDNQGEKFETTVLTKTIGGEYVHLFLDELHINERRVTTCWLIDFGEQKEISVDHAISWLGREPDGSVSELGFRGSTWTPSPNQEMRKLQLFFVSEKSPARELMSFSGVALKSYYIGSVAE